MKSVKTKGNIRFWCISVIALLCCVGITFTNWITFDNRDMYDYILIISSVMGGFMFAGSGILILAIEANTIWRYWKAHYLDNLYRVSVLGAICNILAAILSIAILCISSVYVSLIVCQFCVGFAILGLVYFVWSAVVLLRVFKILQSAKNK